MEMQQCTWIGNMNEPSLTFPEPQGSFSEREVYGVQRGSVFTSGPSPENPPKRYAVLKVLWVV